MVNKPSDRRKRTANATAVAGFIAAGRDVEVDFSDVIAVEMQDKEVSQTVPVDAGGIDSVPSAAAPQSGRKATQSMGLRFEDEYLPLLLAEVAGLEGRKKHPMALRALRIGLEQIKSQYEN